jgi:vacuolar-type H+-ATPase subunit I/STV1
MNKYEERQEARRQRLLDRASKARSASQSAHQRAREMASVIPFGQPILIGHHSEGRDRNYRDKIHNTFGKSYALDQQADTLEQRAAGVGTAGISSDDPDAIEKLRIKLAHLEKAQATMKAANIAIRKKDDTGLTALGLSETQIAELKAPDFCGRVGFAAYALQNNNADIRRVRQRIEELEKRRAETSKEEEHAGYVYREDIEENRIMFIFPGKPDDATRAVLKRESFKWSPSRGAWVRQLTNAGKWHGQEVINQLRKLAGKD